LGVGSRPSSHSTSNYRIKPRTIIIIYYIYIGTSTPCSHTHPYYSMITAIVHKELLTKRHRWPWLEYVEGLYHMLRRLWRSTHRDLDPDTHIHTHTHTCARARRDFIYRPVNTFSKLDIRDNNVNTEWCLLSHYYGRRRRSGIIIYRVRVNLSFLFVSLYYIHSIAPPPLHTRTSPTPPPPPSPSPTTSSCGLLCIYTHVYYV